MSCAGIPASDVQRANFHTQNDNDEFKIFWYFYVYLMASYIFGVFFFVESPVVMPELSN